MLKLLAAVLIFIALGMGTATAAANAPATPAPTASPYAPPTPNAEGAAYAQYREAYWKAQQAFLTSYMQDQARQSSVNVNAFVAQGRDSDIVLGLVIFIVLIGLLLAVLQVAKGLFYAKQLGNDPAAQDKLQINMQGVELQSSSIGLLILVVSLAFFFLYLKYVYPITTGG